MEGKSGKRNGGSQKRVGLGYVSNPVVVKYIMETVLSDKKWSAMNKNSFIEINWNDLTEVSEAFKRLLRILEKEQNVKEV